MQTKLAQLSKRLTASVICLIMILSMFTQVAFAWTPPVANGSEGVGTSGGTTSGTFSDSLSGYRVSIISRTGEMVKPPQDFLFKDKPVIAYGTYKNKWGHSTDKSWKRAPADTPMPVRDTGDTFVPNGAALRRWIMGADGQGKALATFMMNNFNYTPAELSASLKDIKTVFEPVFFYRLQTLETVKEKGKKTSYAPIWRPDQRIYGTITQMSQFAYDNRSKLGHNWIIQNKKQIQQGPIYGGNTGLIVTKVGPNALLTDKDDPELGINKAALAKQMEPAEVTNIKNGIGLHIYDFGAPKPPKGTSTCDEPGLPTPHPAPDPKDKTKVPAPETGEDITKTRIFNIVKTYRADSGEGAGMEHVITHTRQNNPSQILIEDERDYKVVEWFISSTYNNPSQATTWEENHIHL